MTSRLTLALGPGGLLLPDDGSIAVLYPRADADLSALPRDRTTIVQPNRPDHDALSAQGFGCMAQAAPDAPPSAAALVFLPRSKGLARAAIAQAAQLTRGLIVVDGAKTDGVESVLKEVRHRVAVDGVMAKAHGKIFWFTPSAGLFDDWIARPGQADGFITAPGVFSADGIDPASRLLAETLPVKLGRDLADLGAGWGYLSTRCLERPSVETLHLVEADHAALDCARLNITDPRAAFHWADATRWQPPAPLDTVVMNPPFHTARSAAPALGQAFIVAAAGMLKPQGSLWLVANRHLPYEATLSEMFRAVAEVAGDARFKILHAQRPSRARQ